MLACAASGSDDDPASASIDVSVQMRSNNLDNDGTAVDEATITDEWAALMDEVGGMPVDIRLDSATIALEPTSSGVANLGEVFNGPLGLRIEMNGSGGEYNLAEGVLMTGDPATSADLSLRFDFSDVDEADTAPLIDGAFLIEFVGQASDEFRDGNFTADLTVTFRFVAE